MTRSTLAGFTFAALAGLAPSAHADSGQARYCSDSLVRGTYAIQLQGTRPAPDGTTESVIGVVIRLYDGKGGVTQWDNVKGAVSGYTPNRFGTGTYKVNDDCTVDVIFHPAPTITLQERMVIVDNGRELRSITVLPPGVMVTSVQQRI